MSCEIWKKSKSECETRGTRRRRGQST